MSADCTTCEKTICQSTETLFCSECQGAADAASLTDECVQTTSYMCNAGTLTEDYCKDCDFTAAPTEACFTTVSPGVDHICDKPQAVQFSLAMGLTADTFTDEVKNGIIAELVTVMNKDATVVSAEDMDAELDTGRRRRLAAGDVIVVATVPEASATTVSDAVKAPTFMDELNTGLSTSTVTALNTMAVTEVGEPTTTPVTTTTSAPAPTDPPATDAPETTAVDSSVATVSMLVASLMALFAM